MDFMTDNIADTILSGGDANSPAVLQGTQTATRETVRSLTHRTGCALLEQSRRGDRIGILSENSMFFIRAYLGIIHAGRVAVPLHGEIQIDQLTYIIQNTEIETVFLSGRYSNRLRPVLEKLGVRIIGENDPFMEMANGRMPVINPDVDLASIMFTSGSTGIPKGVMVTHRNIECNSRDIIQYLDLTASERVMVVLPFHYCFGASLLHTHLMAGGSIVLNNQFMYPETVLDDMEEKACTGFAGVPSTYQILLRCSTFRNRKLPALRWVQQAGGKLPDPFIEEITASFTTLRFFLMYGQTEATARLSYLPPEHLKNRQGSIGKGLASCSLEVLKKDGTPVTPGSDEIGEIVACGENITRGYWKDEAETSKFFRKGKLFTGDLARVDADGFIYVMDRARDFIKTGGKRVGAKEVENIICELPDVVETAVIGVPHATLGEAIKAYVVLRKNATCSTEDVRRHIAARVELFKVPESIEFIDNLPKNSSGKILKPKLRELNNSPA